MQRDTIINVSFNVDITDPNIPLQNVHSQFIMKLAKYWTFLKWNIHFISFPFSRSRTFLCRKTIHTLDASRSEDIDYKPENTHIAPLFLLCEPVSFIIEENQGVQGI